MQLERGLPVRKRPLCHELGGQDARAPLEEGAFPVKYLNPKLSPGEFLHGFLFHDL